MTQVRHTLGRIRDAEIAEIGEGFGWTWVKHPDYRKPMPLAMMRACGFHHAAEELEKEGWR